LPQSDERVPLRVGREDLRRPLLNCRNRPPQRPERSRRHPRRLGTIRSHGSRRTIGERGVSNYVRLATTADCIIPLSCAIAFAASIIRTTIICSRYISAKIGKTIVRPSVSDL